MNDAKAHFDREGYVHIPGFFDRDQVRSMEEDIQRYIRDILPSLPVNAAFYEDKADPASLFRLDQMRSFAPQIADPWMNDPRVTQLVRVLLDDEIVPKDVQLFGKAPRVGKETPAHQDGYYFMLEPNEALTVWIPLDKTDRGNGCIQYVRGSHRRGLRPHGRSQVFGFSQGLMEYGDADRQLEVAIEAEPGDLIVHHSLTIHRADPNPSDRRRWALGLVYFAARAKRDDQATAAYAAKLKEQWKKEGKL